MNVHFEFKDKHGTITMANNKDIEMDNEEILILFQSKEVKYPLEMGDITRTGFGIIENIEFDMYRYPHTLRITLREKGE